MLVLDVEKRQQFLEKYNNPKLVIVIGDSAREYILALRMKAIGYIHRGAAIDDAEVLRKTLSQEIPDLKFPNILYAQTGKTIQQEIMRRKQMIEGSHQGIVAQFNKLTKQNFGFLL